MFLPSGAVSPEGKIIDVIVTTLDIPRQYHSQIARIVYPSKLHKRALLGEKEWQEIAKVLVQVWKGHTISLPPEFRNPGGISDISAYHTKHQDTAFITTKLLPNHVLEIKVENITARFDRTGAIGLSLISWNELENAWIRRWKEYEADSFQTTLYRGDNQKNLYRIIPIATNMANAVRVVNEAAKVYVMDASWWEICKRNTPKFTLTILESERLSYAWNHVIPQVKVDLQQIITEIEQGWI